MIFNLSSITFIFTVIFEEGPVFASLRGVIFLFDFTGSPIMFCQALLSDGFFLWDLCCLEELRFGREIFGSDEGGGELDGGSNKSERSEAEPGEKGESKSMSIGEPPSAFNFIGRTADTFAGNVVYRGCLFLIGGEFESITPGDEL